MVVSRPRGSASKRPRRAGPHSSLRNAASKPLAAASYPVMFGEQ
jgi:hypothetical protein